MLIITVIMLYMQLVKKDLIFKMASLGFTGTVDYEIADYTKLFNNNQYPFVL